MPTWFMIDYSEHSTWQCAHFWSHNLQLQYTSIWQLIWDQTTSHLFVYNLELPNKYDHWDFSSRTDGADRSDRTDMIDIFSWHSRTLDVQGSFRNCDVFFMSDSLSIRDGWGYQSRCVFGNVQNGLWPPLPSFSEKYIAISFQKKVLFKGPKSAI